MSYQEYFNLMGASNMSREFTVLFFILTIWSLIWKGIALWKAAQNNSKYWYVAMLVINTVGLLEIVYIFFFSKKEGKNRV
jgi:uncharacterized membrane protein